LCIGALSAAKKKLEDDCDLVGEHEQFISEENDELKRIREKKLTELKARREMSKPVHVTDENFDEMVKKHPLALIDFWADWCGPCRALAPTIEELHNEYTERVFIGKLDVDKNPQTAERFQVFSIPTMVVIKDGKEVDRVVGCVPKKNIEVVLKKHLG
jgi:thioredoxin 1